MYSKFSPGWPGIALLLLRVSTAACSIASVAGAHGARPNWYLLIVIPLCAALCAGFLTPLAALLAAVLQLVGVIASSMSPLWSSTTIVNLLALAILGSGAYSIDALLFGQRLLLTNRHD
jgi:uncharacterized membrane protein YphA (DoxX/SURF4 family)